MRDDYMGRFGDAPGGFHSATTDELALTMLFGTRIDTIDLMQVMHVYESMAANDGSLMDAVSGNGGKVTDELKEKIFKGEVSVNDAISLSSPPKQCGFVTGPNLVGQFKYGVKTGIDLIHTGNGKYKMLVFTGSSDKTTARNVLYTAADVRVKDHKKLNELIIEHGFSHHLAMVMTDISRELKVLCEYYGIEYVNPDEQ
jgi:L-arabinose isomerase